MTTLEMRVREELDREFRLIEAVRRDPSLLAPAARRQHDETVAMLQADWERAREAVDALSRAVGPEASRHSTEFGHAWRQLKSDLRRVLSP